MQVLAGVGILLASYLFALANFKASAAFEVFCSCGCPQVEGDSRPQCAELVRKYGKALVTHRPVDTTRLLGELCTMGVDTGEGQSVKVLRVLLIKLCTHKPQTMQ